jgi:hypothetical protein
MNRYDRCGRLADEVSAAHRAIFLAAIDARSNRWT